MKSILRLSIGILFVALGAQGGWGSVRSASSNYVLYFLARRGAF